MYKTSACRVCWIGLLVLSVVMVGQRLTHASSETDWQWEQRDAQLVIQTPAYRMTIIPEGFRFGFERLEYQNITPHPVDGLQLGGKAMNLIEVIGRENGKLHLRVGADDVQGTVVIRPYAHRVEMDVKPDVPQTVQLRVAGIAGPVYGLMDHGGSEENANLFGQTIEGMHIDGRDGPGRYHRRFLSSFAIYPQNRFAGVIYWTSFTTVQMDADAYSMRISEAPQVTAAYFMGSPEQIYLEYRESRIDAGFPLVKPKFKWFELGWETWDAHRFNTNQATVKETVQAYLDRGFPIRWVVTGSGFWAPGHITTSFGQWHPEKYPDPAALRHWLHERDIAWIIGLRTNFIAEASSRPQPADPSGYVYGPHTDEGLERGFFKRRLDGSLYKRVADFPGAPNHLLDGRIPEATRWFADLFEKWEVDGVKEDTWIPVQQWGIFNEPMYELAQRGFMVMARNGAFTAPGTLNRTNDMYRVDSMSTFIALTFFQHAASAAPNNYSDSIGFGGSMRNNSKGAIRHAWMCAMTAGAAMGATPWHWPEEELATLRKATDFHVRLAPYKYDAAMDSYHTGYPYTFTPLHIAFPDDEVTHELVNYERQQYHWLIGESLLAVPLMHSRYRETDLLDIYLPEGQWMDYETGQLYEGPQMLRDFQMPLDKTPVFVGGKGIIVERPDVNDNTRLTARVFPVTDEPVRYDFTWPDGTSRTTILKDNTAWNADSLNVTDQTTGQDVTFQVHVATGAIEFTIKPGHDYRLSDTGHEN